MNKVSQLLMTFIILFLSNYSYAEDLQFVQITDPHLFEADHKDQESRNSLMYFYLAIEKANHINGKLKNSGKQPLDFILLSGDIGIEKLLKLAPRSGKAGAITFKHEKEIFDLVKDQEKWDKALLDLANLLQDSDVKTWLFVPGNNDIYEDKPETIKFYQDFIVELRKCEQVKKANIRIVDFRLESNDIVSKGLKPGVYEKGDLLIVGFDNSFFKNQGSLQTFLNDDRTPKSKEDTIEYQHIKRLSDTLKDSKKKYAYIFMHIPEVDDPWFAKFDAEDVNDKNPVYKRMKKAQSESLELAKGFNPYSSWMVPAYIREQWEGLMTNKIFGNPEIKGIFTGHFHDKAKETYLGFHWLKSHEYNPKILSKLYISPTVSIKNQLAYLMDEDCARGMQYVTITESNGNVKRKIFWLYTDNNGH